MGRSQPRGHSAKLHYRDGGASRGTRLFWVSGGGASQRRCSLKQGANNLKRKVGRGRAKALRLCGQRGASNLILPGWGRGLGN